jgi:hypothetical protein
MGENDRPIGEMLVAEKAEIGILPLFGDVRDGKIELRELGKFIYLSTIACGSRRRSSPK